MPTGYTADVADGKVTDFRTFALRCARAFGATIMQRDDPMNEPPKPREESDYYAKSLAEAEARLAQLTAMSAEDAERAAQADFDAAVLRNSEYEAECTEKRNRYNAMLAEVVAWTPPTSEHEPLKKFMVEQLTDSRKWDCGPLWDAPTRQSGAEWLAEQTAKARESVARRRESLAEEKARVAGANGWITALYDALPQTVPA